MAVTCLVLLSGGHDSANMLRQAVADGHKCQALFVDYGQPAAARELCAAVNVADQFKVYLHRMTLPHMHSDGVEYQARNMVLLAHATSLAAHLQLHQVMIGCTPADHDRFPDCRPDFINALDQAAQAAYGVRVVAPMRNRSSYIVANTWSCYEAGPRPCGRCLSCTQQGTEHVGG